MILALPVKLWSMAEEHVDGLLREFSLLVAGAQESAEAHVPSQLLALVEELQHDYHGVGGEQGLQLARAAAAGIESLDLVYSVPVSVAAACRRLNDALDAADQFCAAGEHLLSLGTPPRVLEFRRWYLNEFVAQVEGEAPTSWSQHRVRGTGQERRRAPATSEH